MARKYLEGLSAKELFKRGEGIVYNNFLLLNTRYSDIEKSDISLETTLGAGITLQTPILASPMDRVTSPEMCIAIALEGGIGCLHYNFKKNDGLTDIEAQASAVRQVKRFENGFIDDPVTISPDYTIDQVIKIMNNNRSGKKLSNFPVTQDGEPHGRLVGLLREQDYSIIQHKDAKVEDRMVKLEKLIYAKAPMTLSEANEMLWSEHLLILPVADKKGNLVSLVTRKDIDKNEQYPLATKDDDKRLRVLFAVETRPDVAYPRLEACFAEGADGVIIDTSQGFTKYEFEMAKYIAKNYPGKLMIGGNISTRAAYEKLRKSKIHSYRNGQGSGSICSTITVIGTGRSGASAIYHSSRPDGKKRMYTIADGGIKTTGDMVKALAIGADVLMLGNMLAGTKEAPGDIKVDPSTGIPIKEYRGMGSKEAMGNVSIRGYSNKMAQGVTDFVEYKGSIHDILPSYVDSIKEAFKVHNVSSIDQFHKLVDKGIIRFEKLNPASEAESRPHSLLYKGH